MTSLHSVVLWKNICGYRMKERDQILPTRYTIKSNKLKCHCRIHQISCFLVCFKDVRLSVNLLDRFVQGESLNQVVITLYPGDEGYTLALKIQNTLDNETAPIPYEEDELLKCIESQQLPSVLVELLEEAGADVFYDGCVFVEVKDLRDNSKQSWNVLLKPSSQVFLFYLVDHQQF